MKTPIPATPKARELLAKLQALAERGVNGERDAAKRKLARLLRRYDFAAVNTGGTDIFAGVFIKSTQAAPIIRFDAMDWDIANAVKWSIESATGVQCLYHDGALLAEAAPSTANRLHEIAATVAASFAQLWTQFKSADGVNPADRGNFIRGLFDGMMNEARDGQPLPARFKIEKLRKAKKRAVAHAPGIGLHPYSVAVNLGKQIRLCVPADDIAGQLERTVKGEIAA